jgi:phosphoenolpyruvate carboxykinase (GTP)
MYAVNWFRKGDDGKFVWPGYGENMRVLKWMIDRLEGSTPGVETGFGIAPAYSEITWKGLDFTAAQFDSVTSLNKDAWKQEFALHTELFSQLSYHLPKELEETKAKLEQRLTA